MAAVDDQEKPKRKIVAGADPFGAGLKDALVCHLRARGVEVEDLGVDKYYSIAEKVGQIVSSAATTLPLEKDKKEDEVPEQAGEREGEVLGLLVCGTGTGVSIFANKLPRVYAAKCENADDAKNARSINNSNVIALGAIPTTEEKGKEIVDTWLDWKFKQPCPASKSEPWPDDIQRFLDNAVGEMAAVPQREVETCPLCSLTSDRSFQMITEMPGGKWTVIRESPTTAVVKFLAGSIEPAHHHSFSHDIVVLSGKKKVQNLTAGQDFELGAGDFLSTPAGNIHRVYYFVDTEFFIKFEGKADILLDEDLQTAKAALGIN